VAIIVAVLIVFVAIILTLFARTTGRWCFAGEYLAASISYLQCSNGNGFKYFVV